MTLKTQRLKKCKSLLVPRLLTEFLVHIDPRSMKNKFSMNKRWQTNFYFVFSKIFIIKVLKEFIPKLNIKRIRKKKNRIRSLKHTYPTRKNIIYKLFSVRINYNYYYV